MTKSKKQNLFAYLLFLIIIVAMYVLLTYDGHIYGSTIDWQNQHYLIPEYLRNLFYDTKDLFPNFTPNLGGGQNIYYVAYYGLFSPIILISYLFPFISMINYIILSSLILIYISTILFYHFLRKHSFSYDVALISSILFLCAGPLLYHTHRHIMFINYMPFLIIGFYGIDKYFFQKKSWLLILSVFLIIMTSFYYVVGSSIALYAYYIYLYLKNKKFKIKEFIISCLKACLPFIIGILMSMILILPTLYVLLNSRGDSASIITLGSLLKPDFSFRYLLHDPYSIGTISISLIACLYMFITRKKENIFLSIVILLISIFPIFNYVFNGTLYVDAKALIPFLPLVIIIVAKFLKILFSNRVNIAYIVITSLICIFISKSNVYAIWDLIICLVLLLVYYNFNCKKLFTLLLCIICIVPCIIVNETDDLLTKDEVYCKDNKALKSVIPTLYDDDDNIYRTENMVQRYMDINSVYDMNQYQTTIYSSAYNKIYNKFYYNVFNNSIPYRTRATMVSVNNPLFQIFMGEKYIITKGEAPLNSSLITEKDNVRFYRKDDVLPIGYSTNRILDYRTFNQLSYPNTVLSLLNNIIVNDESSNSQISNLKNTKLDYSIIKVDGVKYQKTTNGYKLQSSRDGSSIKLKINNNVKDKIMFIRFKNDNIPVKKKNEYYIEINGDRNKISHKTWKYYNGNEVFDYTLYDEDELDIKLSKGSFDISNIEVYLLDYNQLEKVADSVDEFIFDKKKTKGDNIVGSIDVTNDGYFTLSIPYDNGFKVYLDGEETKYEKVNTGFIGFKINKGHHDIKITYRAPFQRDGMILSSIGMLLYLCVIIYEKKTRKN